MPSKIYRELTGTELSAIVKKHFAIENFTYSVKTGGMFNTTYLLNVDGAPRYVLRAGPIRRELLVPFEYNLMKAEEWFDACCDRAGVPVSKVVVCDSSKQLIDRDYMIVDYIESRPLCEVEVPEDVKNELYHKVGEYAADIHAQTGEKFGRLSLILQGEAHDSWSEFLRTEIEQITVKHREINTFSDCNLGRISNLFEQCGEVLDEITTPRLVHADLWAGNVLVSNCGGKYEVAAIIDGDRALFGDPEFELASGWMINDAFLTGYRRGFAEDVYSALRRKLYSLLFNLIDCYVLIGEYDDPVKSGNCGNAALACLDEAERMAREQKLL